ncbi:MAG TPA: helix-hairpin-helix domain-containing protein [Bacillota bacterium]|nr:helix-hairpin-helix domain-containing protein [Bacillota bacterium]
MFIIIFFIDKDETEEFTKVSTTDVSDDERKDESNDEYAIVDVKGEVIKPGVYDVPIASRVHDVLEMAGGFTEDADESAVNLAKKVYDEMVIFIPKIGDDSQLEADGLRDDQPAKMRINEATQEEIETLNGIGPSKAEAIIQYREEHGYFQTLEDLLEVSGIGEKTLDHIKEDVQIP